MVRFVDLFAGMGGMRLGLEQALDELGIPYKCVMTSEIKPHALKVYKDNFGDTNIDGDITKISEKDVPDCDIVIFGNPCQSFSSAGKRLGFEDSRGNLFFEVIRILKEKRPKYFLMENVENLVTHNLSKADKKSGKIIGETFETVLKTFEDLGYKVNWRVLQASDYGTPQIRRRVYVVGSLDRKIDLSNFEFKSCSFSDIQEHGLSCVNSVFSEKLLKYLKDNNLPIEFLYDKAIRDKRGSTNNIHSWTLALRGEVSKKEQDLLERMITERRRIDLAKKKGIKSNDGVGLTIDEIKGISDISNIESSVEKLVNLGYLKEKVIPNFKEKVYDISGGRLSFEFAKILDPNKPSLTLVATEVSRLGVIDGDGIRKLTIKECLRLNGFPDDYIMNVDYKKAVDLLGNTVVVPVIKMLCKRIFENEVKEYESL